MLSESMPPVQRRHWGHRTAGILPAQRHRNISIFSSASVVKKSSSMNSESGIWNTLIRKEAAEVKGGPTRITDQQFGGSDDFFLDHRTLLPGRSSVPLCLRGEDQFLFIDSCSWVVERSAGAHGPTRLLLNSTGSVVQTYDFDGSGNALGFTPSNGITAYLYNQQYYDVISGQYYARARNYDPATGTFTQKDSYTINPGDLANANLFLFAGADPINMFDPSGHFGSAFSLSVTLSMSSVLDSISLPAIGGALAYVGSAVLAGAVACEASTWLWSTLDIPSLGTVGDEIYNTLRSDTQAVVKAIDDVAAKLDIAVQDVQKLKVFPIIRRLMPDIYAFDTFALEKNPSWYMLTYNGPGNPLTARNRAAVRKNWGYQMATAQPGDQLDEFPYASTFQGGAGAYGRPVPGLQNALQGGLLGAFYRFALESVPDTSFIVVPIPL